MIQTYMLKNIKHRIIDETMFPTRSDHQRQVSISNNYWKKLSIVQQSEIQNMGYDIIHGHSYVIIKWKVK